MKKSCIGCRALLDSTKSTHICTLGYKLKDEVVIVATMPIYRPKPLEECPKPKTYGDLIYLMGIGRK